MGSVEATQRQRSLVGRGLKPLPIEGAVPQLDTSGFVLDGRKVSMGVMRRRGLHPLLPGVFYWVMQHCGRFLFSGWLSASEAHTLASEVCSGERTLRRQRE
eukprot:Amastigsp_a676755_9.p2 type:complete len:101 gc:universal Amastigsp_a676755_9:542-240(-)